MLFEWDEKKNQKNIEKHGIDFNDAKEVFNDKKLLKSPDLRQDYGEERWKVIGGIFGAVIAVIYTLREAVTRIISARRASQKERDEYNNQ
jgi:uncharacterized DUF497 family protein